MSRPNVRVGDLVIVNERCFGEADDGVERWVEAGSLAEVYQVEPYGIGVAFPNGVSAIYDGDDMPAYPFAPVEGVTFDGVWRPVAAVSARKFAVARSYRLAGGAPAQQVFTAPGGQNVFDFGPAARIAEALTAGRPILIDEAEA